MWHRSRSGTIVWHDASKSNSAHRLQWLISLWTDQIVRTSMVTWHCLFRSSTNAMDIDITVTNIRRVLSSILCSRLYYLFGLFMRESEDFANISFNSSYPSLRNLSGFGTLVRLTVAFFMRLMVVCEAGWWSPFLSWRATTRSLSCDCRSWSSGESGLKGSARGAGWSRCGFVSGYGHLLSLLVMW